ncbi:MAG: CarD family transcriptional regulator [Anaerolineae bacterium]|nr:CarD family transcriptional regulator [Anaerolineae bacterium]
MQFKVCDLVVLPSHGIGHIEEIEKKNLSEQGVCLYYKITLSKRTIWIPVETHEDSGLRLVTTNRELDHYRILLKSPSVPLGKNHRRRHLDLVGRLKQGTFQTICEVVRDLTASGRRKPLGRSDAALLQKTRQNLDQEWATAAGISTAEAIKEIDSLLLTTK